MPAFTLHLLTLLPTLASAACYYQNGTDVTEYSPGNVAYQPCSASAEASMCCRTNVDDENARDHCRADGLCESPRRMYLWRESCTDPSWESPHCLRLCLDYGGIDPFGNSVAGVNTVVTACDDGSYCCGFKDEGADCCRQGSGVWMVDGKETSVNPNATSASASSSSSTTLITVTGAPSRKTSTAAIAGGVVGGVAGLAMVAGALWWWFRGRRKNGDLYSAKLGRDGYTPQEIDNGNEKKYPVEMPNAEIPCEADGMQREELDGGTKSGLALGMIDGVGKRGGGGWTIRRG